MGFSHRFFATKALRRGEKIANIKVDNGKFKMKSEKPKFKNKNCMGNKYLWHRLPILPDWILDAGYLMLVVCRWFIWAGAQN